MASSSKVTSLSEVPVSVLARQLTLKDLAFLKAIQTPEFCGSNGQVAWMKPNKQEISPNILKSIVHANHLSYWVASEILRESSVEKRAAAIEYFIQLLEELDVIYSYNVFASVVHGLRLSSVDRLKQTWALVSAKSIESWNANNPLIDQYARFDLYDKRCFELSSKPYVPFLGASLHQIHEMEKGSKDTEAKRSKIENLAKEIVAQLSLASKHFEETVKPVEDIQSYLRDVPVLSANAAHERSLELEPRAKVDSEPSDNLKESSDSLTSNAAFFWGVPLIAAAAIALTAVVLYKRQK